MKKGVLGFVLGLVAAGWVSVAAAGQYEQMVGKWTWEGFTIEVTESGEHGVSAKVVNGPKNVGMEMIQSDLAKKGEDFVGKVRHPGNGKVYNTKISRKGPDAWKLDGCTDGGACASGVFTRAE